MPRASGGAPCATSTWWRIAGTSGRSATGTSSPHRLPSAIWSDPTMARAVERSLAVDTGGRASDMGSPLEEPTPHRVVFGVDIRTFRVLCTVGIGLTVDCRRHL